MRALKDVRVREPPMGIEYLGEDLEIVRVKPRPGERGAWVDGTTNGYRFQAFVSADGRITRLWVWRQRDEVRVLGPGEVPADEDAREVVEFLDANLALRMLEG